DFSPPDESYDAYIHLLSLPGIFTPSIDAIPASIPYLHADPARVEAWKARLASEGRSEPAALRVGIVWAGNPRMSNERNRSCGLAAFGALAGIHSFFSLQKG